MIQNMIRGVDDNVTAIQDMSSRLANVVSEDESSSKSQHTVKQFNRLVY
jgi:hypothetical protein